MNRLHEPGWPILPLPWATNARVRGPRRWWDGPLDVEGLAVGSVSAAATAANALAAARDSSWRSFVASGLAGASFGSISRLRIDGTPVTEWAPISGFYPTRDGWIRLHGNYPHHARVIEETLKATDRATVAAATAHWDAVELETTLRAAGGIAGALRTAEVWRAHPQFAVAVQDRPLITLDTPTGVTRPLDPSTALPLQGFRVLDLTRVIAGPTAARFLGALGADVLHIDPPGRPELLDQHLDTGFAKRSSLLDFAADAGRVPEAHAGRVPEERSGGGVSRPSVTELLMSADVVLTGYRPGALARFGLDRESLLADHPQLVVIELSAWGDTGPWGDHRGFDSIVQAVSGIATTYADDDRRPGALPVQALDHATGYLMATAVLRLLARRPQEGGASARVALARTADWLLHHPAPDVQPTETFDGPESPLWLASAESSYGRMEYVRPPVFAEDLPLDFPSTPRRYGADPPEWWMVRE